MLKPNRRLGQNFLVDNNIVHKIVDSLTAESSDCVVEIGPGTGALTRVLIERFEHVVAVEVDARAVDLLERELPTVDVRHADILDVDIGKICGGSPIHVVGNLPYYITSPILFKLLDSDAPIRQATIMMQLEVARRLVAVPRTKDYGILSVSTQLAADVEILFKVSRNVFRPVPNVESAVVQLTFEPEKRQVDPLTREVVRTAFNQRRKTLRNSLKSVVQRSDRSLPAEIGSKRPEELTPEEFVSLASFLKED